MPDLDFKITGIEPDAHGYMPLPNREVFERLYAYRRSHGIATWEQTIEQLLLAPEDTEVLL